MNKYKQQKAASVHQLLLNKARQSGRPFNELLQYYAMERFLYRISQTDYVEKFVLKGALLLRVTGISEIRFTRDIDFLALSKSTPEDIKYMLVDCCQIEIEEDGLAFNHNQIESEEIRKNQEHNGYRFKIRGNLGNAQISIQIDMGFGDVVTPQPLWIEYPSLLDTENPKVQAYTLESAIAEKYQTMINLDLMNSRMKDFYDSCFLSQHISFNSDLLQHAIQLTFNRRKTAIPLELPIVFTPKFYENENTLQQWKAFRRKLDLKDIPAKLQTAIYQVKEFIWPVNESINNKGRLKKTWQPGIGWH